MSWAGNVWGKEAWGQGDNGGSWANREASSWQGSSSTHANYAWPEADYGAWTERWAGGNSQASPGGDQKDSKKGASSWITLGMKHPLPVDERRELLIALLELIRNKHFDILAVFPSVAVAQWDLVVLHAALFYLCKAGPSTPLRILRDPADGTFTIDFAAGKLHETFVSLYPVADQQRNAYQTLLARSFENTREIIKVAMKDGFHPHEVEPGRHELRLDPRGGSPLAQQHDPPSMQGVRQLARHGTEEELDRLRKKEEIYTLQQKHLLRNQALSPSSRRTSPSPGGHATSPSVNVASPKAPQVRPAVEAALRAHLPAAYFAMPAAVTAPPAEAVAKLQDLAGRLCSEQSSASHILVAQAEMLAARTAQIARTESDAAHETQGQPQLPTETLAIFSEHATGSGACLDAQKARDVAGSSEMEMAAPHRLTHEAAESMCVQESSIGLSPSRAEMALVAELQEMKAHVAQQQVQLEEYMIGRRGSHLEERELAQERVAREAERAEQAEAGARRTVAEQAEAKEFGVTGALRAGLEAAMQQSGQQHEQRAQMDAMAVKAGGLITEMQATDGAFATLARSETESVIQRMISVGHGEHVVQENTLREIAYAKAEQCKQQEERDAHLEIAMAKAEAAEQQSQLMMMRASNQSEEAEMAEAATVRQAASEHASLESKLASQAKYAEHELALSNAAAAEKASELAEQMKLFAEAAARQSVFETEIQQLRDQVATQESSTRADRHEEKATADAGSAPSASVASGAGQAPPTKRPRQRS